MSQAAHGPSNRLAGETSPYLLQHQYNPVDWYPWGPDALDRAKRENKPILLSVGYAACHWCHVMAHESFEDPTIAAIMNRLFINIKVDREERPDLDTIYQSALALLGEHGGWPLTMFLTPEGEPFWGGTYFPPAPRFGRPAFPQILEAIASAYTDKADEIRKTVTSMTEALAKLSDSRSGDGISGARADEIAQRLVREIDPFHGGFGRAPKFPQVPIMKLLWRAWKRQRLEPFKQAVELTMTKMCQGGIYDHLGGGFARYSVDERWLVPHFEKMLYDNAQLIEILTWLWQDTRNPLYAQRVEETVDWLLREMIAFSADGQPTGAFASTLDADSEGEEGKFYVWTEAEIDAALGDDAADFKAAYDVVSGGNWEGKTILNRTDAPDLGDPASESRLAALRGVLLAARGGRVRPGWDDKVLADWNGLMIAALVRAASAFDRADWLEAARTAFHFVVETMEQDDRLWHSWRRGQRKHAATLDDYAQMAEAALALHEATGSADCLAKAEAWVATLERHYWDAAGGGYFMTADDTERLIVRPKNATDNAVPAGNGTMVGVLARLFYLTGKDAYRARAEAVIAAFSGDLDRQFFSLATLINNALFLEQGAQLVIVGDPASPDVQALVKAAQAQTVPDLVTQIISPGGRQLHADHPATGKGQTGDTATAYVCRGPTCSLPMTDPDELSRALA